MIREVDPRHPRPLGHDGEAIRSKPLADFVAPGEQEHLLRILERTQGTPAVWEELAFVTGDGRTQSMLCCFQRLAGADLPRGAILVTALELAALASDLRTEAAAVLGQLAFRCHGPAHRLMQAVEAILSQYPWCEAAQRCRTELDALLEALSLSAAWPEDAPGGYPVDVIDILEGTLRLIDGDPDFTGLDVNLRPEVPWAWAKVHPVGLAFVTLHLVASAVDATLAARSPRLFIDVNTDGNRVAIEFHDNGRGLDREDLKCVFAPFFNKGHAGLGLATCSELVHAMGGTIRMNSRPSQGTTVVVTLPAAPAPMA
jgi:signal transduction histidine kinase